MQSSRNGNDLWLSHWVDAAGETESITFYLVTASTFFGSIRVFVNKLCHWCV